MTGPAITLDAFVSAARAKVAAIEADVARLRVEEAEAVAYAATTKTAIGKAYWHDRQRAEEQLRCARALLAGLEEGA